VLNKKIFILLICILFLLDVLIVLGDTTISACNYDTTGVDTYLLSSDLTCSAGVNGILIDEAGATLDCQGHTIKDGGAGTTGIYVTANDITIQNCYITNFDDGIQSDALRTNIIENKIYSNLVRGIYVTSNSGFIYKNDIYDQSGSSDSGIHLSGDNNKIYNNSLINNDIGINLFPSSNNNITDTYISSITNDIKAQTSSINNLIINTTLAKDSNSILTNSEILRLWKGVFRVVNSSGGSVSGVNVTLWNSSIPVEVSVITGSDGYGHINLTKYKETSGGKQNYTNYNVSVWKIGFNDTNTSFNFDDNFEQTFTLVDDIDPVVSITSPADLTENKTARQISIDYSATEANGLSSCSLLANGTQQKINNSMTSLTSNFVTSTLYNGDHNITVRCTDTFSNIGENQIKISVNYPLNVTGISTSADASSAVVSFITTEK